MVSSDIDRRTFISGVAASLAVPTLTPILSATEAIAKNRWDKLSIHDAMGDNVPIELLMRLKVEPPKDWREKLGGKDTGIIVNPRYHRMFIFKNGHLEKVLPVSTGSRPRHSTPTGLRHIGKRVASYFSKKYGNAPMPHSSFLENANGNDEGIAIHGSNKFKKDRHGREFVQLDSSHGCLNMRDKDAEDIFDTFSSGTPVYILNDRETSIDSKDRNLDNIPGYISTTEKKLQQNVNLLSGNKEDVVSLLQRLIKSIPVYYTLPRRLRRQVYGKFEHTKAYSITNPAVRLRNGASSRSERFNAVKISGKRLLKVVGGKLDLISGNDAKRALESRKFKGLRTQKLTSLTERQLHGKWATAFGYGNDGGWTQVYAAGFLLNNPKSNSLLFVTKDPAMIIQGTPMYVKNGLNFEFCGVIRGGGAIGGELYGYKIHGPSAVKGM